MSEAARSRWPVGRSEPQLNRQDVVGSTSENPLAELARLVGQDDSFRNAFASPRNARTEPQKLNPGYPYPAEYRDEHAGQHEAYDDQGELPAGDDVEQSLGLRPSSHEDEWSDTAHEGDFATDPHYADQSPEHEYVDYDPAPSLDGAHDARDYVAPPLTPDLWAERGEPAAPQGAYGHQIHADHDAAAMRAPRRPLVVLASVLVLTGGGLAATFLARAGTHSVVQGGATPTIMAATGPNKIKLADSAATSASDEADSALLNKNGASSGAPVKVVNSQEQPIDLTQLPKAAASVEGQTAADSTSVGSASPFPEPRKVKTFLVRPDGTMIATAPAGGISTTGSIPATARHEPQQAQAGLDGSEPRNAGGATSAPRPSTPKTSTRTETTPKAPPTSIADLATASASDPVSPASKSRQAASPGARPQNKSKPVEVADASTSDASAVPGGAFGLQLAAATSEQDARSIFARLQKKYSSELGAFKPTIRKADTGDKSIYRVRVGNLEQAQAKSLCSRLQAGGGTCFVIRN